MSWFSLICMLSMWCLEGVWSLSFLALWTFGFSLSCMAARRRSSVAVCSLQSKEGLTNYKRLRNGRRSYNAITHSQPCLDVLESRAVTDDGTNDPVEHRRILSLAQLAPRPVFRDPFKEIFQQWKNSSSRRSNKLMIFKVCSHVSDRHPGFLLTYFR